MLFVTDSMFVKYLFMLARGRLLFVVVDPSFVLLVKCCRLPWLYFIRKLFVVHAGYMLRATCLLMALAIGCV